MKSQPYSDAYLASPGAHEHGSVRAPIATFILIDKCDNIIHADINTITTALNVPPALMQPGAPVSDTIRHVGDHARAIYHEGRQITIEERLALRQRRPYRIEFQFAPDLWLQSFEIDTPLGSVLISCDISQQKVAAKKIAEKEELLRTILDNIPVNISVKDSEARCIYVNQHALRMLGAHPEEILGRTQAELFPNDYGVHTYQDELSVLHTGQPTPYQEAVAPAYVPAGQSPGEPRPPVHFFYRKLPLTGPDGKVDKCLSIAVDITDRKRAAAELADLQQQLMEAQKTESIATLSSGIAHDVNNILAIIQCSTELSANLLGEHRAVTPHLKQILDNTRRGAALVRQILDYARPAQRPTTVMSLARLIDDLEPLMRATIGRRISLQIDIPSDFHCAVDRDRLLQVFLNLATNAAQAMPDGGIMCMRAFEADSFKIPIGRNWNSFDPNRRFVCIEVSDTGPGIPPEIAGRIFDPFFSTKPKTNRSGTGLGLPIARTIIQNHGGAIQVHSEPGFGAVFDILLPLSQEAPDSVETALPEPAIRGNGQEVLIVDDEAALANSIAMLLDMRGFRTCTFTDAIAAFETARAEPERFSVILADVNMPDMTGIELANALAEVDVRIPIVFLTGQDLSIPSGELPGVVSCLAKPIDAAQLTKAVLLGIESPRLIAA